jgi:hypothetical protein NreA
MRKLKQPPREAFGKRLKRAAGHLNATFAMIEANKPCLDLAQQLAAVEAAIGAARRQAVEEEIAFYLQSGEGHAGALQQLRRLSRYLYSSQALGLHRLK